MSRILPIGCERVLIVDDDPDLLGILGDLLDDEGLSATRARSGEEALSVLARGPVPDLVLVDLVLPRMSGAELVRRIRANPAWSALPVAVMTANRGGFELLRAAGADEIVEKPFSLERLNEVLTALCPKRSTA